MEISDEEVRALDIPHLNAEAFKINDASDEQIDTIRKYLRDNAEKFCDPFFEDERHKCNICKEHITWSFNWGITHGQGYCGECHWPYKAYHRINEDLKVTAILAYHPDLVLG